MKKIGFLTIMALFLLMSCIQNSDDIQVAKKENTPNITVSGKIAGAELDSAKIYLEFMDDLKKLIPVPIEDDGSFEFEVPKGKYNLSIEHPSNFKEFIKEFDVDSFDIQLPEFDLDKWEFKGDFPGFENTGEFPEMPTLEEIKAYKEAFCQESPEVCEELDKFEIDFEMIDNWEMPDSFSLEEFQKKMDEHKEEFCKEHPEACENWIDAEDVELLESEETIEPILDDELQKDVEKHEEEFCKENPKACEDWNYENMPDSTVLEEIKNKFEDYKEEFCKENPDICKEINPTK